MPYFDSDNQNSARDELIAATGSAFGAFLASPWGSELAINSVKYGAKGAWWGLKKSAKVVKTVTPPIARGIGKALNRSAIPLSEKAGNQVFQTGKQVVGGTIKAGLGAVSWVYKHPVAAPMLAAGAGAGLASFENRPVNSGVEAYGSTDVMGGVSNTTMLMNEINASGSIVFGLNNKR